VRNLEFRVYDSNGVSRVNYDSRVHGPPAYLDIFLEVMGRADAIKAGSGGLGEDFFAKNSQRYQTRVFFLNREGYSLDD
jgi:hypothetical protein